MNPSTVSGAIIIGVLSGVGTYVLVFLLGQTFRRLLLPWYQDVVYKGVRVDGEWDVTMVDGNLMQSAKLNLRQAASSIDGTCMFLRRESDIPASFEQVRAGMISGSIRDRFVELSFRHVDQTRLGTGVFLLEVKGDGRQMHGQQTFYSVGTHEIVSFQVIVTRPSATSEVISERQSEHMISKVNTQPSPSKPPHIKSITKGDKKPK